LSKQNLVSIVGKTKRNTKVQTWSQLLEKGEANYDMKNIRREYHIGSFGLLDNYFKTLLKDERDLPLLYLQLNITGWILLCGGLIFYVREGIWCLNLKVSITTGEGTRIF